MRYVGWSVLLGLAVAAGCTGSDPEAASGGTSDGGVAPAADGAVDPTKGSATAEVVGGGYVVQGVPTPVHVKVTRAGSFTDSVAVSLQALPPGSTSSAPTIPAGASEADLSVTVPTSIAQGPINATLRVETLDGQLLSSNTVSLFVRGRPGTLDTTFGVAGIATPFPVVAMQPGNAAFVDPDGKIVFAGSAGASGTFVARLLPNGAIDTTFGTGAGVVYHDSGIPFGLWLTASGAMQYALAAGSVGMRRLTVSGDVDATFGTGGVANSSPPNPLNNTRGFALFPDGSVAAGGTAAAATQWSVAKFRPDGTLDTSFHSPNGSNGGQLLAPGTPSSGCYPLAIGRRADGNLSFVTTQGTYSAPPSVVDLAMVRLSSTGELVASFGSGGLKTIPISSDANRVFGGGGVGTFLGDEAFLLGSTLQGNASLFSAFRLDGDGNIKLSKTLSFSPAGPAGSPSVVVHADGSVGYAWNVKDQAVPAAGNIMVLQLTAALDLDGTFGTGGQCRIVVPGSYGGGSSSIVVYDAFRYAVVGFTYAQDLQPANNRAVVARVWR